MIRRATTALLIAAAALVGACRENKPRRPETRPADTQPARNAIDSGTVRALAVANAFCEAWRTGSGRILQLRSTRLRRKNTEESMRLILLGTGNPRHDAFELFDARAVNDRRVAVKVRLFTTFTGEREKRLEAPLEQIVVVHADDGRWLVDEFPGLK